MPKRDGIQCVDMSAEMSAKSAGADAELGLPAGSFESLCGSNVEQLGVNRPVVQTKREVERTGMNGLNSHPRLSITGQPTISLAPTSANDLSGGALTDRKVHHRDKEKWEIAGGKMEGRFAFTEINVVRLRVQGSSTRRHGVHGDARRRRKGIRNGGRLVSRDLPLLLNSVPLW